MTDLIDNEGPTKLSSSNINTVAYDGSQKILTITFNEGGVYEYYQVPSIVDYEIRQSASAGKYFHSFIREKYSYKRVG